MGIKKPDENKSDGLALLLNSDSSSYNSLDEESSKTKNEQLRAAVAYVLGFTDQEASVGVTESVNYDVVREVLQERLHDVESFAHEANNGDTDGRLGPSVVHLDLPSISGELKCGIDGLSLESLANFSSCRASTCVYKGKWMYEATVGTAGIQQIGWATIYCPFTNEEGVGDAPDSYAYDGKRLRKWSVKSEPYGENWAPGDVIGCCLDLDERTMTFVRNGRSLGVAYRNLRTMQPHLAYFPAVSLSSSERCELNFGAVPFQYPVEGYRPMQDAPPQGKQAVVASLLACFQRLVGVAEGDRDVMAPGLYFPRLTLASDESNLLASVIWEELGPRLADHHTYLVSSHLLPLLLDLYCRGEPHRPASLSTAVKFLERCLSPSQLSQVLGDLLEALARRCRTARLMPDDFPYSAAYPYLSLVCALLRHEVIGQFWLSHPQFHVLLEGFITRKAPTAEDLKTIFPQVWWRGARGEEGGNEEGLRASARALSAAVAKVEERQFELLTWLLDKPAPKAVLSAGFSRRRPEGANAFCAFLDYILYRNRGSARDVQPPGLSDQTVLTTMYYVLLRLLRPHFDVAARGEGPLSNFPVDAIFLQVPADTDPMADVSRLGGLLSHLLREAPITPLDRSPLNVTGPQPLEPREGDTAVAAKLPAEELPALLNSTLLLYSWRVGSNLRMAQQFGQQLAGSVSSLEELERHQLRDSGGSEYAQYMSEIRQQLRDDIHTNVRYLTLCRVVFLSPTKQEAMFTMAAYVASLVLATTDRDALPGYIPTCYVESLLDLTSALRRTETPFATAAQLLGHGMHAFISLFCRLIKDTRVANPDVRENVLNLLGSALDAKEYAEAFAQNGDAKAQLVVSVMGSFDSRYWHPISIILLRLVKGTGFGQAGPQEHLSVFQQAIADLVSGRPEISKPFLNKLFNMLNWGFTEFSVIVSELHDGRVRSHHAETTAQNTMRKGVIMFDLSVGLMRILEFVANQVPSAFLPPPSMNLSRLQELLGFVLTHFTSGPDARRLTEVLQHSRFSSLADKVSRPAALGPLLGVLLGLWQGGEVDAGQEFVGAMARSSDTRLLEYLEATAQLDWLSAFPSDPALSHKLAQFQKFLAALKEARSRCEASAAATAAMEADIPDDFLDPITMVIMHDPVVLPDSQVVVDRATIERHLMQSATDPFSRKELRVEDLIPAVQLKERIHAWVAEHQVHS